MTPSHEGGGKALLRKSRLPGYVSISAAAGQAKAKALVDGTKNRDELPDSPAITQDLELTFEIKVETVKWKKAEAAERARRRKLRGHDAPVSSASTLRGSQVPKNAADAAEQLPKHFDTPADVPDKDDDASDPAEHVRAHGGLSCAGSRRLIRAHGSTITAESSRRGVVGSGVSLIHQVCRAPSRHPLSERPNGPDSSRDAASSRQRHPTG
jgi:hypothetical protein